MALDQKTKLMIGGALVVFAFVGIGIMLYFVLRNTSPAPPPTTSPPTTPTPPVDGEPPIDRVETGEWVQDRELTGTEILDVDYSDIKTQDECYNAAKEYSDAGTTPTLDFIQWKNTEGEGEGDCTFYQFQAEGEQYKQISYGTCEEMGMNNINTYGLQWHAIANVEECDYAIQWLLENTLLYPGGSWYRSAHSSAEMPIQVDKSLVNPELTQIYACLNNSGCVNSTYSFKQGQHPEGSAARVYPQLYNDHGTWKPLSDAEPPARADCVHGSQWCSHPGTSDTLEHPTGCYTNADAAGNHSYHKSVWFNKNLDGTLPTIQRPIVCYAHSGTESLESPDTSYRLFRAFGNSSQ